MHEVTHAPAHVSRCMPSQQRRARPALRLCFQLSPGHHSPRLCVHWLPVTRAVRLHLSLSLSLLSLFFCALTFPPFSAFTYLSFTLSRSALYPSGKGIYYFCPLFFAFIYRIHFSAPPSPVSSTAPPFPPPPSPFAVSAHKDVMRSGAVCVNRLGYIHFKK